MRKLTLICTLVLLLGIGSVASAEVQRIRVSGDIDQYFIWSQYDGFYQDSSFRDGSPDITFFYTISKLNFDADLTDNVSARLALANQRVWDHEDANAVSMDVGIREAYVVLKEMLYEPLTLTIGRQPLYYGRGFIIGSNVVDPEGSATIYDQLSVYDGFDAIRAVLDYDPITLDLVYSKIAESTLNSEDDINMWIVNVGRPFDFYESEAELYYVGLYDRNRSNIHVDRTINPIISPVTSTYTDGTLAAYQTHTFGGRGSVVPIENLDLFGEVAWQVGKIGDFTVNGNNNITGHFERDVSSWGAEIGAEYSFVDVTTTPKIGIDYTYHEGENFSTYGYAQGDYDAFYTPFMKRSDTAIFGHNGRYGILNSAGTAGSVPSNLYYKNGDFANSFDDDDTAWDVNLHQILVTGSLKPLVYWDIDDLLLSAKYAWFRFEAPPVSGASKDAGDELDVTLTYDYTEDVQFSLLTAWFWPGSYYDRGQPQRQANADLTTHVEAACKVTF